MSQNVIDTTELTPRNLRKVIAEQFSRQDSQPEFRIEVMSFGFKYGLPLDADLVFDVRFLPNPYYQPELRNQTGLDDDVYNYVMDHQESEDLYRHLYDLIDPILPSYKRREICFDDCIWAVYRWSTPFSSLCCSSWTGSSERLDGEYESSRQRPTERNGESLMRKPKMTVIGGGTGISVILDSLRKERC